MNRLPPERTEQEWLDEVRLHALRGELDAAQAVLLQALHGHPQSIDLRRSQAGILQQRGLVAEAEALLRELLTDDPDDSASAFALARLLKGQGRMAAAAGVMRTCVGREPGCRDTNLAISAIELLDDCDRKQDASAIADAALACNPVDARLLAYAGMLEMQLGEFERARRHYLFALQENEEAWEWHVPIGLAFAQRYQSEAHPDLALFRSGLQRARLSELARAELCFAMGKLHDDCGDPAQAATRFREGNRIARNVFVWSRASWRPNRGTPGAPTRSTVLRATPARGFTPIFIVGMPRSGTTLLAELLSHYPAVCNRGELPWVSRLAARPELASAADPGALEDAAGFYRAQVRQDDSDAARWFIDKQPLNFRYIDLMLSMFPDAKVLYCRRSQRDTALSLWMQLFANEELAFARSFDDIATVMRNCEQAMSNASGAYPSSVRSVQYEELVSEPARVVASVAGWLGLDEPAHCWQEGDSSVISTSSLWQARQPVYQTSVGRWKNYIPYVPELGQFTPAE